MVDPALTQAFWTIIKNSFEVIGAILLIFLVLGVIKHLSDKNSGHQKVINKYFEYKILGTEEYDKQLEHKRNSAQENIIEINYQPYRKREYLLSRSEYKFYRLLREMIDKKYVLFAKVRIADIIEAKPGLGDYISFSKIKAKHVDFLVCHKDPVMLRIAIELDGNSHNREDRRERDKFVDEVFANAGIPIVHIKVTNWYDRAELKTRIRAVDKIKYVVKQKEG